MSDSFGALLSRLQVGLEAAAARVDVTANGLQTQWSVHSAFMQHALTPDLAMLQYITSKHRLGLEDITESAKTTWDAAMSMIKLLLTQSLDYSGLINSGAQRVQEHLHMLVERVGNLGSTKPHQTTYTLPTHAKFVLDGKVLPGEVRPLVELSNNSFDFFDKVFVRYVDTLTGVLSKLSFDKEFTDEAAVDFSSFNPQTWLKAAERIEDDDRFRTDADVYRGQPVQGNKALYAGGPTKTDTEELRDWKFMVNTARGLSFKLLPVPDLKSDSDSDGVFDTAELNALKPRLALLTAVTTRFVARKGTEQKLAASIRKLQAAAERVRTKAGQIRTPDGKEHDDDEEGAKAPGIPAVSEIIHDVTLMLHNVNRLAVDYNNAVASQLRLLGGLVYVADLELKAYIPPVQKPTAEKKP
jgi:hypothetical protein